MDLDVYAGCESKPSDLAEREQFPHVIWKHAPKFQLNGGGLGSILWPAIQSSPLVQFKATIMHGPIRIVFVGYVSPYIKRELLQVCNGGIYS